jgi:hypothetical protein
MLYDFYCSDLLPENILFLKEEGLLLETASFPVGANWLGVLLELRYE